MSQRMFLLFFFVANALFIAAQATQTFSGKVLDEKTERIVDEMEIQVVHLESNKSFTTETDEEGVFVFENVPVVKSLSSSTSRV